MAQREKAAPNGVDCGMDGRSVEEGLCQRGVAPFLATIAMPRFSPGVEKKSSAHRSTLTTSRSLRQAVNKAPELCSAMALRLAAEAGIPDDGHEMPPQAFWIRMPRILHGVVDDGDD
ncbi:hypothetical protein MLD38_014001 [Melastoma candidum]|uniref:Uncharacterized protein n=1 Tax=Melastoma candidum TaxID=119954 RepID=A0ACB9RBH9_9MYRT|nr:hypothetical protein MLD38_014001 [Melastoma candidum]